MWRTELFECAPRDASDVPNEASRLPSRIPIGKACRRETDQTTAVIAPILKPANLGPECAERYYLKQVMAGEVAG
jgi:hypothetical protein